MKQYFKRSKRDSILPFLAHTLNAFDGVIELAQSTALNVIEVL